MYFNTNDKDNLLQIIKVNCQNLGNIIKRSRGDFFSVFKKKNYQVFFLQNTHFTKRDESLIQTPWGYRIGSGGYHKYNCK